MSCKFKLSGLDDTSRSFIEKSLVVETEKESVSIFDMDDEHLFLPFHFARTNFHIENNVTLNTETDLFTGELRPQQQQIRNTAMEKLQRSGSVIIAAFPGFGKTITAIEMLCSINVKTMIMVKQIMVMDQWINALKKYAPTKKVHKVTSGKTVDASADVFLVNPVLLKTATRKGLEDVKLLIVDEMHQIVSPVLLRSFFRVQPDFVIGLSATPRRPKNDPYQQVIEWFFGDHIIGVELSKKHTVYTVNTGFKPTNVKYTSKGMDWNDILNQQSENEARNIVIVDSVMKFPQKTWIVLVKRVEHAAKLQEMFLERDVVCDTMTGAKKTFDKNCKVLIGTTSKIGVGFDHSPIDALCVATDVVEYFEQFLGRCMRRVDSEPIVLDFDDNFATLHSHYLIRLKAYKKHGGVCKLLP
jgi:superfamily II DNA or RNA helicase